MQLWHRSYSERHVVSMAEQKLLCSATFDPHCKHHVLAVFSHRIELDIPVNTSSSRLAITAVQSHMRILLGIVDRSIAITMAPSEPILSIAAAEILLRFPASYKTAVKTLVNSLIISGHIIPRGTLGELVSQFFLTIARDEACSKNNSCLEDLNKHPRVRTITLYQLLYQLMPEGETIDPRLQATAEKLHLNFTHFVQVDTAVADLSVDYLRALWDRGAAIQCVHHQPVIDKFVPAYSGPLTEPWDNKHLTVVCWQDKLKEEAVGTQVSSQIVALKVAGARPVDQVVMIFDMGTTSKFQATGKSFSVDYAKPTVPTSSKRKERWAGYAEEEKERWVLNFRGLNSRVAKPYLSDLEKLLSIAGKYSPDEFAAWRKNHEGHLTDIDPLRWEKKYGPDAVSNEVDETDEEEDA